MDAERVSMGSMKMPHSHSTPAGVDGGTRTPPTTPKKGGKILAVRIQMLDDSITMFQVQAKATGRVLFEQVCKQLHLLEADYFGLEYQEPNGTRYWLDLEKPLSRQVGLTLVETLLRFCVKFYTPDPAQLEEEFTRYLYCLQVKRDLCQGLLQCNDNTSALMASYIVQAECGDYVIEDYPDHTYLSHYKFAPSQDGELERRIMENHKKHAGQSPAEADLNLLETSRRCELYGMKMHAAKDHEGVPLNLAVAHMGIVVFQNYTKINTFSWAKIRKISFKRKRFLVKLHPEGYGYYKDTVEFFFEGRNECKNFWKKCVENHGFFRCSMVKRVPRQKTRVLSRGSSFRYSGKTQKQIVEFVRENYVKRQTFQRSQSFRHSSSVHSSVANVGQSLSAHPLLPLGDNAVAGTQASLSCGSMTLSSERRRRTPSLTSSPTHAADVHDFDTRDYPCGSPSPPLTSSSVTSSPQHFYPSVRTTSASSGHPRDAHTDGRCSPYQRAPATATQGTTSSTPATLPRSRPDIGKPPAKPRDKRVTPQSSTETSSQSNLRFKDEVRLSGEDSLEDELPSRFLTSQDSLDRSGHTTRANSRYVTSQESIKSPTSDNSQNNTSKSVYSPSSESYNYNLSQSNLKSSSSANDNFVTAQNSVSASRTSLRSSTAGLCQIGRDDVTTSYRDDGLRHSATCLRPRETRESHVRSHSGKARRCKAASPTRATKSSSNLSESVRIAPKIRERMSPANSRSSLNKTKSPKKLFKAIVDSPKTITSVSVTTLPKAKHGSRYRWQRSSSCRDLHVDAKFMEGGGQSEAKDVGRGYYDSIYLQDRKLDSPVTKYDESLQMRCKKAKGKTREETEVKIYSSSYPGTTSSMSTESGNEDQVVAGGDCLLITGDGSLEEIQFSHDDVSHDSYEILAEEARGRGRSYDGTRSCSLDSEPEIDGDGEIFQMDDDRDVFKRECKPQGRDNYKGDVGDFRSRYQDRREKAKFGLESSEESGSGVDSNVEVVDYNEYRSDEGSFSDREGCLGFIYNEFGERVMVTSMKDLSSFGFKEMVKGEVKEKVRLEEEDDDDEDDDDEKAQTHFTEYNAKCEPGLVIGFDSPRDSRKLQAHTPIERAKSDPFSRPKRHILTHQKSIDLTPADSCSDLETNDKHDQVLNATQSEYNIPYTLHKRQAMNGTAPRPAGVRSSEPIYAEIPEKEREAAKAAEDCLVSSHGIYAEIPENQKLCVDLSRQRIYAKIDQDSSDIEDKGQSLGSDLSRQRIYAKIDQDSSDLEDKGHNLAVETSRQRIYARIDQDSSDFEDNKSNTSLGVDRNRERIYAKIDQDSSDMEDRGIYAEISDDLKRSGIDLSKRGGIYAEIDDLDAIGSDNDKPAEQGWPKREPIYAEIEEKEDLSINLEELPPLSEPIYAQVVKPPRKSIKKVEQEPVAFVETAAEAAEAESKAMAAEIVVGRQTPVLFINDQLSVDDPDYSVGQQSFERSSSLTDDQTVPDFEHVDNDDARSLLVEKLTLEIKSAESLKKLDRNVLSAEETGRGKLSKSPTKLNKSLDSSCRSKSTGKLAVRRVKSSEKRSPNLSRDSSITEIINMDEERLTGTTKKAIKVNKNEIVKLRSPSSGCRSPRSPKPDDDLFFKFPDVKKTTRSKSEELPSFVVEAMVDQVKGKKPATATSPKLAPKSPDKAKSPERKKKVVKKPPEIKIVKSASESGKLVPRSPDIVVSSPDGKVRSPSYKARSPEVKAGSPGFKVKSPDLKVRSPDYKSKSLDIKVKSPDYKSKSPDSKVKSPDFKSKSPDFKVRSPDYKTRSPEIKVRSPDYKVRSPDMKTKSSDMKVKSPDMKIRSLESKTKHSSHEPPSKPIKPTPKPSEKTSPKSPKKLDPSKKADVVSRKRDRSPILFARGRLGISEGSAFSAVAKTMSPKEARRTKSLDAPIVSVKGLPAADAFSSKDDTVESKEDIVERKQTKLEKVLAAKSKATSVKVDAAKAESKGEDKSAEFTMKKQVPETVADVRVMKAADAKVVDVKLKKQVSESTSEAKRDTKLGDAKVIDVKLKKQASESNVEPKRDSKVGDVKIVDVKLKKFVTEPKVEPKAVEPKKSPPVEPKLQRTEAKLELKPQAKPSVVKPDIKAKPKIIPEAKQIPVKPPISQKPVIAPKPIGVKLDGAKHDNGKTEGVKRDNGKEDGVKKNFQPVEIPCEEKILFPDPEPEMFEVDENIDAETKDFKDKVVEDDSPDTSANAVVRRKLTAQGTSGDYQRFDSVDVPPEMPEPPKEIETRLRTHEESVILEESCEENGSPDVWVSVEDIPSEPASPKYENLPADPGKETPTSPEEEILTEETLALLKEGDDFIDLRQYSERVENSDYEDYCSSGNENVEAEFARRRQVYLDPMEAIRDMERSLEEVRIQDELFNQDVMRRIIDDCQDETVVVGHKEGEFDYYIDPNIDPDQILSDPEFDEVDEFGNKIEEDDVDVDEDLEPEFVDPILDTEGRPILEAGVEDDGDDESDRDSDSSDGISNKVGIVVTIDSVESPRDSEPLYDSVKDEGSLIEEATISYDDGDYVSKDDKVDGPGEIEDYDDAMDVRRIGKTELAKSRSKSEEEPSTSSSFNAHPRKELSSTWRPFLLESSGSSSLEEGFFPPDDSAHLADEEETSSTSMQHDDCRDDVVGFGYPLTSEMIIGYGSPFSLSRTLSRISERSTTSEQERSDYDDDSTKPSSRSPSIDDESLLSSDHQPSLSSDPPSTGGGAKSAGTPSTPEAQRFAPPPFASDEDWPSPPTSSSLFDTPVVSHVETFFMEVRPPEEATKVNVVDSTEGGGDESSTDENHTLQDDDFQSSDVLSSSAGTLEDTVRQAVKTLSEDTSMGLSLSDWSSHTVRHVHRMSAGSAKSDDTSIGTMVSEMKSPYLLDEPKRSREKSPSRAKSDTCLDDTTPKAAAAAIYYTSKSLTNVDVFEELGRGTMSLSSERPVKIVRQKSTPYYSSARCTSPERSLSQHESTSESTSFEGAEPSRSHTPSMKVPVRPKYPYYSSAKSPPSDASSSSVEVSAERVQRVTKRRKSQPKRRHRVSVDLEVRDGHIIEIPVCVAGDNVVVHKLQGQSSTSSSDAKVFADQSSI